MNVHTHSLNPHMKERCKRIAKATKEPCTRYLCDFIFFFLMKFIFYDPAYSQHTKISDSQGHFVKHYCNREQNKLVELQLIRGEKCHSESKIAIKFVRLG